MIEVFKTNVETKKQARKILTQLSNQYPNVHVNFDLSDCDRILRVEGETVLPERIIELIQANGFCCDVLM